MLLPSNWFLEVTEENYNFADKWRKSVGSNFSNYTLQVGDFLVSRHEYDNTYIFLSNIRREEYYLDNDYKEITTEQFIQHVYNPFFNLTTLNIDNLPIF